MKYGLTMGDPSGIGIEIILKVLNQHPEWIPQLVLYGHRPSWEWWTSHYGIDIKGIEWREVLSDLPHRPQPGHPSAMDALVQYHAFHAAIDDALSHQIRGIITAPWTKSILQKAGLPPTGHTEILGQRCGVSDPLMLLAGDQLKVALVTTHLKLREVSDQITVPKILRALAQLWTFSKSLGKGRVAVCGLNPHAGEDGTMGLEEREIIIPALEKARLQYPEFEILGPYAADALFSKVVHSGIADFVLAMYHDQGLGPLKLWHPNKSLNMTMGLPFVRTSVNHGTAHDIAGQGLADPTSLHYAIQMTLTHFQTWIKP